MEHDEQTSAGDNGQGPTHAWTVLPVGRRLPVEHRWSYTRYSPHPDPADSLASAAFEFAIEFVHVGISFASAFEAPRNIASVFDHLTSRFDAAHAPVLVNGHDVEATLREGEGRQYSGPETTYAIICVPFRASEDLDITFAANSAFDAALDVLDRTLVAFSLLTDAADWPIPSVRSEDIQFPVPIVLGGILPGTPERSAAIGVTWMLPRRMRALRRLSFVTKEIAADRLRDAVRHVEGGPPFLSAIETRRDAHEQLEVRGDRRLASLLAGIAGEVMIDTLLLHLLWEEQRPPRESSRIFDDGFKARLVAHYHGRLGGDWSGGSGAVKEYVEAVLHMRNRVAHEAYLPTYAEARSALKALAGFERFIGDRLASDDVRNRYPRTAFAWSGSSGLERRGKLTKRVRTLASDEREPNWVRAFSVWRFHFFSARGAHPMPPTPNVTLLTTVQGGAPLAFLALDVTAQFAAVVDDPSPLVAPAQMQALEELAKRLEDAGAPATRAEIGMHQQIDWVSLRLDWKPAYELIPELGYAIPPE